MRRAQVQTEFLTVFGQTFPRMALRGMRQFREHTRDPFSFVLRVATGRAKHEIDLYGVVLGEGSPKDIARMLALVADYPPFESDRETCVLLVAPYLSKQARQACDQARVAYMDLSGNACLDTDHLYIHLSGPENAHVRKRQVRSPFQGKSERVARRLLMEPDRVWSMRELARAAEVSLGLTSMVTSSLVELQAAVKTRSGLRVHEPGIILNAWSEEYDVRRSAYVMYGSWLSQEDLTELLKQRDPADVSYALTLWSGYTEVLESESKPDMMALYWADGLKSAERELQLSRKKANTRVFVFEPRDESMLWGTEISASGLRVAHPLQLYLDLASGDEQELLLAQRLRSGLLEF